MKLDSFLRPAPPASGMAAHEPPVESIVGDSGAQEERPASFTTDITPSGIEVFYQSEPKRLYKVRGPGDAATDALGDRPWTEVPSVTTVLDVLNKGGLTIWGMRVGIKGVVELFDRGHLCSAFDWEVDRERLALVEGEYADAESIEALMKTHNLTTDKVTDKASERGSNVHDALEAWAKTGHLPSPGDFPESEVGYVTGLVAFLEDARPEPIRTEVMVGSIEHGFAGRYDLELRFNETRTIRRTPKRAYHDIPSGTYLVDFKSSKGVYPSTHFRQLAAYEAARVEGGYPATDAQYVLNANGEGSYAFVKSTATLDDFLAVLSVYKSDHAMKKPA